MATTLVNQNLGPAGTPQEVKDLRKSSYDFHNELGSAVIFKHRWNKDDVDAGRTWVCPFHDELYGNRDLTWDETCFGTGYVGGYADGQIVFVTLQDAPEAQIKVTPQGILTMDMQPAMSAPWLPKMGDGDLIITADFIPGQWKVVEMYERYVLQDVTPTTMRGPGWGRQSGAVIRRQRVSQQAQVQKLPVGHSLYDVPIEFDYSKVPVDPTPPYSPDPPEIGTYTEFSVIAHIHGIESDSPSPIAGKTTSAIRAVRITGVDPNPGVVVIFGD